MQSFLCCWDVIDRKRASPEGSPMDFCITINSIEIQNVLELQENSLLSVNTYTPRNHYSDFNSLDSFA